MGRGCGKDKEREQKIEMYEIELKGLCKAKAKFVVIVAIALSLQGYPRGTFDLDILPELSRPNLKKIIQTLTSLNYVPRVPVDRNQLLDPQKRDYWYKKKNMRVFTFVNRSDPVNEIDIMIYQPIPFKKCYQRAKKIKIDSRTIFVASLKDLLILKKRANRPKDKNDIAIIKMLLKRENNG